MSQSRALTTGQYLRRIIGNARSLYAVHTVYWVLHKFGPLLPGVIFRLFFDSLALPRGLGASGTSPYALLALYLASSLSRALLVVVAAPVDTRRAFLTCAVMRRNLLAGVLALPGTEALRLSPGEALNRFRDDPNQVEDFLSNVPDIAGAALATITALWVLWSVDSRITVLVIAPVTLIVLMARSASRALQERRRTLRESASRVSELIADAFSGLSTVKAFGAEQAIRARLILLGAERRKAVLEDRLLTLMLETLEAGTSSLGLGLLLLVASGAMGGASLSVGNFALFASYLTVISEHSVYFGSWIAQYRQTGVSIDRMASMLGPQKAHELVATAPLYFAIEASGEELYSPRPSIPASVLGGVPAVETVSLSVAGENGEYRLADATISIPHGGLTVIAGQVGSGKTTLLRAILGLLPATSGEIWCYGSRIDQSGVMTPPRAAYVPQSPLLLSGSLLENISLGCTDVDVTRALELSALDADLVSMPDGVHTLIGSRGMRLSGGQAHRLALARALATNATALFLDDLSSSLDVETEELVWNRILGLGKTVVAVSNKKALWQRASRIIVMKDGMVVGQGDLASLLCSCEEMQHLSAKAT